VSGPPRVTAVLVAYRSRSTIDPALEALRPAHEAGWLAAVVVDNASDDGTADHVAAAHPWVTLVRSPENAGFGRGCNLGFERVRSPYLLLLNPDASIAPDAVEELVRFLEARPGVGIVGPAIVEANGALQVTGPLPSPRGLLTRALGREGERRRIRPGEAPFPTGWVCGAVMLVRSELFRRLGGFDPRFFLYFEETDLCQRARALGAEVWTHGGAVAEHRTGSSARTESDDLYSDCIPEHYFQSRFHYLVKHFGWSRAAAAELAEVGVIAARAAAKRALGRGGEGLRRRLAAPLLRRPPGRG